MNNPIITSTASATRTVPFIIHHRIPDYATRMAFIAARAQLIMRIGVPAWELL